MRKIGSTEASVYRYFENKHQQLAYLLSSHYTWFQYRIDNRMLQITDANEQLKEAIKVITSPIEDDPQFGHINESKLREIMIQE